MIEKHDLSEITVQPKSYPTIFNLRSITPKHNLTNIVKKKDTSKEERNLVATNYVKNNYWRSLQIFTDGSKDTENNLTGCAFVIPKLLITRRFKLKGQLTVYCYSKSIGMD